MDFLYKNISFLNDSIEYMLFILGWIYATNDSISLSLFLFYECVRWDEFQIYLHNTRNNEKTVNLWIANRGNALHYFF